ncbi:MAG: J domain-containing protein [Bryobacteraceae bacterium]
MEARAKAHRRRAYRKPVGKSAVRLELQDAMGKPRRVYAGLVDVIDGGIGLELMTPVESGAIVVVGGQLGQGRTADQLKAVVRWCTGNTDGTFRAGLEFLIAPEPTNPADAHTLDCYAAMQLSPDANSAAISRAYRLLALRYHPDNLKTGNNEMFLRISEAYQILSDPQKRSNYDIRRRDSQRLSRKSVDHAPVPASNHLGQFRPSAGTLSGWGAALRSI